MDGPPAKQTLARHSILSTLFGFLASLIYCNALFFSFSHIIGFLNFDLILRRPFAAQPNFTSPTNHVKNQFQFSYGHKTQIFCRYRSYCLLNKPAEPKNLVQWNVPQLVTFQITYLENQKKKLPIYGRESTSRAGKLKSKTYCFIKLLSLCGNT